MGLGDRDLGRTLTRSRADDPPLRYQLAHPQGEAKVSVFLSHGFGEHRQRYAEVIEAWNRQGILVASYDLRGHGASGGRRGHVAHFSDYVRDAAELLERLPKEDEAWAALGPPVLFGHSYGGLITVSLVLAHPDSGRAVALSSPFLGFKVVVPPAKALAGRLFSKILPAFSLPNGVRGEDVTRSQELWSKYDNDPLNVKIASARWYTETVAAQAAVQEQASRFTLPLFCLAAGADKLGLVEATERFVERVGSTEKTLRVLPGLFHEILNEPERQGPIGDFAKAILDWRPVLRNANTGR